MEALVLAIAIVWACRSAYLHVTGRLRESRQARIAAVQKKIAPKTMTRTQRRTAAARHDTGWLTREVVHGFPVTRYGWKAGWTAHKAAHLQHKALLGQEKARLAAVSQPPAASTVQPPQPAAAPPGGQQPAVNPAAPAPEPPAAGASPPPAGVPPQPPQADADPEPGPAAPVVQPFPGPPEQQVPEPDPAPAATTQGEPMPTGTATSEYTYDQTIDTLDKISAHAEAAQSEFARLGIPQMTDQLSVSGLDRGNLAHIADVAAAHDRIMDGYKTMIDHATTARDSIQRDHGPVAEAHQAAPEGGAEKPFYAGV
jgi:hypothetical protein